MNVRIRAVPFQPHAFFFGGFDIQMCRTLEVMAQVGLDAKPLDPYLARSPAAIHEHPASHGSPACRE
jgi:hypothetical protein